jgi:hypothetical protein
MFVTRATFFIVLGALAFGHYYYWQVRGEILAAERNHYFVTAKGSTVPAQFR